MLNCRKFGHVRSVKGATRPSRNIVRPPQLRQQSLQAGSRNPSDVEHLLQGRRSRIATLPLSRPSAGRGSGHCEGGTLRGGPRSGEPLRGRPRKRPWPEAGDRLADDREAEIRFAADRGSGRGRRRGTASRLTAASAVARSGGPLEPPCRQKRRVTDVRASFETRRGRKRRAGSGRPLGRSRARLQTQTASYRRARKASFEARQASTDTLADERFGTGLRRGGMGRVGMGRSSERQRHGFASDSFDALTHSGGNIKRVVGRAGLRW